MNEGQTIGHYTILRPLGKGGMGEVYLAQDTKLDRQVAIKVLPDAVRLDPERLARFRREAKAAASLNHPNIAMIHALEEATPVDNGNADNERHPVGASLVGAQSSIHFIVMEYVDGKTLADMIPPDGLDIEETGGINRAPAFFDIFIPLADALAHAHEHGRVHRDIKPGNIMIAKDGTPKILDFGLARIMPVEEASEPANQLGSEDETRSLPADQLNKPIKPPSDPSAMSPGPKLMGTPQYMSPEQAESQPLDHRTDIFSFGLVMYEALTGKKAFEGSSRTSLLGKIVNEDPTPVTAHKPVTPYLLWEAVRRCLEKDRTERTQTARELHAELRHVRQEVETGTVLVDASTMPEPVVEAVKPVPIWRQPGALTVMTILVIAAATVAWFLKPTPIITPTLRKFTLPIEAQINTLDGPVLSPDGTMVVYTKTTDGPLWVRDLNQTEPRVLPGTEGGARPFWSPDSRQIGYMENVTSTRSVVLRTVSAQGGPSTPVCNLPAFSYPRGAVWIPDGQIVFSLVTQLGVTTPGAGTVYNVSATGGEPRLFLAPDSARGEAGFTYPHVLPYGKTIIASLTTTDGTGTLVALTGDSRTELFRDPGAVLTFPVYAASGHIIYQRRNNNTGNVASSVWALPFNTPDMVTTGAPFLVAEAQQMPSVSSDGTLLYSKGMTGTLIAGLTTRQLVWVDRSGTVTDTISQARMFYIALSPDSKAVAANVVSNGLDIWIYDTDLGTSRRLSFDPAPEAAPTWSPAGDQIAFFSPRSGKPAIYIRTVDGRGTAEQVTDTAMSGGDGSMDWSPDGRFLVYGYNNGGNSDLMYVPLKGNRTPVSVLATTSNEEHPSLSPDGRYIAYKSDASGRDEIYVTSFPSGEGQWQVSVNGGGNPRWNGRGDELFYIEGSKLMAVPVKATSIFEAGTPQVLFAGEQIDAILSQSDLMHRFDVSKDGQRFVMLQNMAQSTETSPTVTVVENWSREFDKD